MNGMLTRNIIRATVSFSFDFTESIEMINQDRKNAGEAPMTQEEIRDWICEDLYSYDFSSEDIDSKLHITYKTEAISDEDENTMINYYECNDCNQSWEDTHSCACNDKCPSCNKEIEPFTSEYIK